MAHASVNLDTLRMVTLPEPIEVVLFGKTYKATKLLPYRIARQYTFMDPRDLEAAEKLKQETIDYVFGAGTFAAWTSRDDCTPHDIDAVALFIRSNYDQEVLQIYYKASGPEDENPNVP